MEEFANKVRRDAEEVLQKTFHHKTATGTDPIIELIAFLLNEEERVTQSTGVMVTPEQWLTWNRLVSSHQEALARTMTREITREQITLPTEMAELRTWAAQLVLRTLDRLGMA